MYFLYSFYISICDTLMCKVSNLHSILFSMDISSGKDILEEHLIFIQNSGSFNNSIELFLTGIQGIPKKLKAF